MSKLEILGQIDQEWQQFSDVAGGFSEEGQLVSGAVGHWNVREALIHVAAWDEELVKMLETYLSTREERDFGDDEAVDQLNEGQVDEKRELTLDGVWTHLRNTHQALLEFVRGLPEDVFSLDSYTGDTLAMETWSHYRDHREDLERFKLSR
jgi:hypothetical protein